MPSLQLNKMLGALRFQSHGLELPTECHLTSPPARQAYMSSLPPSERVAVPKLIPAWYRPALPIAPHQLMCDDTGQSFKDLHDVLLDAIAYGHNLWRMQAKFAPMPIAGAAVSGLPGCLTGPPLDELAKTYPGLAKLSGAKLAYRDAVLGGVAKAYTMWQSSVTVPGLPFFPSYNKLPPGPAVPASNVPQKLIACVSVGSNAIVAPDTMKQLMVQALAKTSVKGDESSDALFDAIATVLSLGFVTWLANQMVLGIVGSGSVVSPTGGPVAGVTLPTAGHLAT